MLRTEKKKTEINQQWNYQQTNGIRKKKTTTTTLTFEEFSTFICELVENFNKL